MAPTSCPSPPSDPGTRRPPPSSPSRRAATTTPPTTTPARRPRPPSPTRRPRSPTPPSASSCAGPSTTSHRTHSPSPSTRSTNTSALNSSATSSPPTPSSPSSTRPWPNAAASSSNASPSTPRPHSAVALVRAGTGEPAALYLDVQAKPPHRIETIALDQAPAEPLATSGPYTGSFEVNGRQLFLTCVGHGEPTVVLVGGLTSDWTDVQRPVSDTTRVCSYDKPNVLGSRSDHVPTPRDAAGMADELAALLHTATVPAPYVVVGHSDGGMVAQLF